MLLGASQQHPLCRWRVKMEGKPLFPLQGEFTLSKKRARGKEDRSVSSFQKTAHDCGLPAPSREDAVRVDAKAHSIKATNHIEVGR